MAALCAGGLAATAAAQEPATGSTAAQSSASGTLPVSRFVPRDNLAFYVGFDGIEDHAAAWEKTAACRMLNQTPLGVMLEEVVAQLLEKPLEKLPNRKVSARSS